MALALVVGLLVLATCGGAAMAEDRLAARKHYDRALALINLNDHRGAIEEFRKAYVEAALPNVLYNLGFEYETLGREGGSTDDLKQAAAFYRRYLQARPDAADRAEVMGRIEAVDAELARRAAIAEVPPSPSATPTTASASRPAAEGAATPRELPLDSSTRRPDSTSRWKLWLGVGGGVVALAAGITLAVVLSRPREAVLSPEDLTRGP